MGEFLVANPFLTAWFFILFTALVKITFVWMNASDNIDRLWRAVGATICTSTTLTLLAYVLLYQSGMIVALTAVVSVTTHLYINWTIGLWRDRRDRHYPFVLNQFRDGRGIHFYRLIDTLSHGIIVGWVCYVAMVAAPLS